MSMVNSSSSIFNKRKYRGLLAASTTTRGSNPLAAMRLSKKKDEKIQVKLKPAAKLKRAVGKLIAIQGLARGGVGGDPGGLESSPSTRAAALEERGGDEVVELGGGSAKHKGGLFNPPLLRGLSKTAFGWGASAKDMSSVPL